MAGVDFALDVLGPEAGMLASFSSSIEAYRYASLISGPARGVVFRRPHDGVLLAFQDCQGPVRLRAWAAT